MSSEHASIVFWGLVYLKEIISINSSRIQAVKVWPVPKSAYFILPRVSQSTEALADNYMREMSSYMIFQLLLCQTVTQDSDRNLVKVFREV